MHITRKLVATVAVPAALALSAAGAYAATSSSSPIDSSGVIHGCYSAKASHGSHTITLQNAGTGCPRGTTAVTWNQKGETGPARATTAGPSGLDVIITAGGSQSDQAVVRCPSDHPYAVGGGGNATGSAGGSLTESAPLGAGNGFTGGWLVHSTKADVAVFAVCAK
jgi:hypothetical protein